MISSNPSSESFITNMKKTIEEATEQISKSNEEMMKYANRKRLPTPFKIGDKVLLSMKNLTLEDGSGSRKLHPKYCGPFEIIEKVNDVTFRLDLPQPMIDRKIHNAFHSSLLKPYIEDKFGRKQTPPSSVLSLIHI